MSLVEAYKMYNLREERRLNTHPLFKTARSGLARRTDGFGAFHEINQTDLDDPAERQGVEPICCLCPCWTGADDSSDEATELSRRAAAPPPAVQLGGQQV